MERESKNAPFFSRSLTLVPRSLLQNRMETLATEAIVHSTLWLRSLFNCNIGYGHTSLISLPFTRERWVSVYIERE